MFKRKHFLWPIVTCFGAAFWAVETPLTLIFQTGASDFFHFNLALSLFFLWETWSHREKVESEILYLRNASSGIDSWFIFGIVSSLPYDLFLLVPELRPLALLKLLRLMSLGRTYKNMHVYSESPRFFRLLIIFTGANVAVHIVATSWLAINPMLELTPMAAYIKSIYWAVTTLTTTGYGDITPTNDLGRVFTVFVMLTGFSAFGVIVGNISNLIMAKNRHKEANKEKMEDLSLFMQHYDIPRQLRSEVYNFHSHRTTKRLSEDDSKIISDLPQALKNELQVFMKIKLIDSLPVFHGLSKGCLKQVALAMEPISFHANEIIIKKGNQAEEMYIIDHGEVEVLNDQMLPIAVLKHGQCLGETALLKDTLRTANVVSKSYCDVYCLKKRDFLSISETFPELEDNFRKIMNRRNKERAA